MTPRVKAFYETPQKRGKKKIQALCAVMRKYLTGLRACIKSTPLSTPVSFSAPSIQKFLDF
jgi:hypothetical protein